MITIPIYGVKLKICLYDDIYKLDKGFKYYNKKFNLDPEPDEGYSYGMVFLEPLDHTKAYILLSKPNITHELIAHEISHLTFKIFFSNNIEFHKDIDDENFALLQGYLTEMVYKELNKNQLMLLLPTH